MKSKTCTEAELPASQNPPKKCEERNNDKSAKTDENDDGFIEFDPFTPLDPHLQGEKFASGVSGGGENGLNKNGVLSSSQASIYSTFARRKPKITMRQLDEDVIGCESGFWGPFGWQKYTYADHNASGRSLKCIEEFIEKEVLPHYANTHTTVAHTARQTTNFREEARAIIKQAVGGSDSDEVIFCGSGTTAVVHKLLHAVSHHKAKSKKLVVFVGPYEHHSNILPWREYASKVIQVPSDPSTGQVDLNFLEAGLKKETRWCTHNQVVVGSFSAASNVTGALTDDIEVTTLLHKYGALAFWDYAAAAPHVHLNMNSSRPGASKDAMFFSGHKFLGGPQTPGVLVVKKHVMRKNSVPHGVGGGTVLFTTTRRHQYLKSIHEREEGGTPDIVGAIRLGLVFRIRNLVGVNDIIEREAVFCRRILKGLSGMPEIHILGSAKSVRLPTISFLIEHLQTGYFLHHNFVVALLNDLYGIQCRGGCMCAGPYGQLLLGIGDKLARLYESNLSKLQNKRLRSKKKRNRDDFSRKYGVVLKPGFVRISPAFHYAVEEVDFIIEAVKTIARHGWRLLPFYRICWKTASFTFNANEVKLSLEHMKPTSLSYFDKFLTKKSTKKEDIPHSCFGYTKCLQEANFIMTEMTRSLISGNLLLYPSRTIFSKELNDPKLVKVRWFMSQYESVLLQQCAYFPFINVKYSRPFQPIEYDENLAAESAMHWKEGSIPHCLALVWKRQQMAEEETDLFRTGGGRGEGSSSFIPRYREGHSGFTQFRISNTVTTHRSSSGFDEQEDRWTWEEMNDDDP